MDKIRIGDNEYQPPFRVLASWPDAYNVCYDLVDANGVAVGVSQYNSEVSIGAVGAALNELASLRAENEAFREDHHKHDEWMAWAQSYFNDNPDLCMWGSRLDVGIRETLIMRDQELAQLRSERDALKARVETRDALINVMAPMHQLTCRNHKICPICKAYDKYSKEIDGESVDTTQYLCGTFNIQRRVKNRITRR